MNRDPNKAAHLTCSDWAHRLAVLRAWEYCEAKSKKGDPRPSDFFTNRAAKDGCAVTIRTLCYCLGVGVNFQECQDQASVNAKILEFAKRPRTKEVFPSVQEIDLLILGDVLFLANRAVAHLEGDVQHTVGPRKLALAINLVLAQLAIRDEVGLRELREAIKVGREPRELLTPMDIADFPE